MSKRALVLGTLAVAGALVSIRPASAQEATDLRVRTRLTVVGAPESAPGGMITGGIPLPASLGVTDVADLGIWVERDRDRPEAIPVQWRVTSRWGGEIDDTSKPIRWVLATFPGSAGSRYAFTTDRGRGTLDTRAALGRDTGDAVSIDTGRIAFTVPKDRFAPLAGLRVGGDGGAYSPFGENGLDVTMVNVEKVDENDPHTDVRDVTYRLSDSAADLVTLEENGPLRSVVRIRGRFTSAQGEPLLKGFIGYTIRLVADAGSDSVRMFFTLENNGQYGAPSEWSIVRSEPKWLHIRKLELSLPTNLGGDVVALSRNGAHDIGGGDLRLLQTHELRTNDDESRNFTYKISSGGRVVGEGDRSDGGLAFGRVVERRRDGTAVIGDSVMVAMRHFWQNYPKAISLAGGVLKFELWPQEPGQRWPADEGDLHPRWGDAYQFEGGRHKTYEMLLAFPGRGAGTSDVAAREGALQAPAYLHVDPAWVEAADVMGALGPIDFPVQNPDLRYSLNHFSRMQLGQVDVRYCDPQGSGAEVPPASLITQRERRGNAVKSIGYDLDLYGFMNFGDLPHDGGFCSGHYDWIRGLLMNYVRFGRRDFMDVGIEMMRHRYDIDQFHGQERVDPNWSWFNGFQRADVGHHGAFTAKYHPNGETTPTPQRTALEGLLLGYAMTGDPRALETARENAEAFANYYTHGSNRLDEAVREPLEYYGQLSAMSVALEQLLAFYEFTGERKYLDTAELIFEDGILFAEEYLGNNGFFGIEGGKQNLFPIVRLLRPLMRMHEVRGDTRALALLLRILAWVKEEGYAGSGIMVNDRYMPLALPYHWVRRDIGRHGDQWYIPYNFFTCDAYTYAFRQTGEPSYMQFARELFRDSTLFYQAPMHQPVPADFYSRVSYVPLQYPGSETKTGVWLLQGHNLYLSTEHELWKQDPDRRIELRHDRYFTGYSETKVGHLVIDVPRERVENYRREPNTPTRPMRAHERMHIDVPQIVPSAHHMVLRITTDELTQVRVDYRVKGEVVWRSTQTIRVAGANPVQEHTVQVSGLEADTEYEMRIQALDTFNQMTATEIFTARTAAPGRDRLDEPIRGPLLRADPLEEEPVRDPRYETTVQATPEAILLDEDDARFEGNWSDVKEPTANGGTQKVAGDQTTRDLAEWTVNATRDGPVRLWAYWGNLNGASAKTHMQIRDADGVTDTTLNQAAVSGRWRLVGQFRMSRGQPFSIVISNRGADGAVAADALKLEPVPAR